MTQSRRGRAEGLVLRCDLSQHFAFLLISHQPNKTLWLHWKLEKKISCVVHKKQHEIIGRYIMKLVKIKLHYTSYLWGPSKKLGNEDVLEKHSHHYFVKFVEISSANQNLCRFPSFYIVTSLHHICTCVGYI